MNKLKKINLLLLTLFLSFVFMININAADINPTKGTAVLVSQGGSNPSSSLKYQFETKTPKGTVEKKYISSMYFFGIKASNGKVYQAYCIEPGVHLNTGDNTKYDTSYDITSTKKTLLGYILTTGHAVSVKASESAYRTAINSLTGSNYYKALATQAIIWEIMSGERTNFNTVKPNKAFTNGFYNVIDKYKSKTAVNSLLTQYTNIVKDIQKLYLTTPMINSTKKFGTSKKDPSKIPSVVMTWKTSSNKYEATLTDTNNSYSNYESLASGIDIKKTSNKITASNSDPIKSSDAIILELTTTKKHTGYDEGVNLYDSGGQQDLVIAGYVQKSYYAKFYTEQYQLKVKKVSNDNTPLANVEFNLYSNKTCTNLVKSSILKTAADGTAIYKGTEIPSPGTYYIKEVSSTTPKGYNYNSTCISATVTTKDTVGSSNLNSSNIITNTKKVFKLDKVTVDENNVTKPLNDGCGTDKYTGPTFTIKDSKGNLVHFVKLSDGKYEYKNSGTVTEINTCNGTFNLYTLPDCNYTITETKAPEGLVLPSNSSLTVNVCKNPDGVRFTNGFVGMEFQKIDEDGKLIPGGKYSLQRKENNVYKDVLLVKKANGSYEYNKDLKPGDSTGTYLFETNDGIARISKLPPAEYRVVEKEAPEGYELIEDRDSTATATIKDDSNGYYLVQLVNHKISKIGSDSSAELIVAITTGRDKINYPIVGGLIVIAIIVLIIIRKKIKK